MTVLSLIADRKVICEYFCAELFLRGKEKMKLKVVFFNVHHFGEVINLSVPLNLMQE